ncbi:helix-turn-helix transcriptional regulator [Halorubrum cibi]|uniref:Predicted transcriptional regulator, contains HTH domain n=1 Tax=Halorubrum cibi TaxID=413815 RepID=A0A521ATI8_9EURY|nr:transcriptional regulator [Halorubrum cibi]SMO38105.1 Predicted transcriptional regulator, contains HTH domain [Halorubrum cibi]
MASDSGHDDAQYLAGSPVRIAILRALGRKPRRPASLTDAVDATRTTVQRILAGFRERQWVVKRGSTYHVTPTGERVHDAYEGLLSEIDRADRYGRFAADLERAGAGFPADGLETGDLTAATDRDPLAALDRVVELIRTIRGSDVRAVSPIVTTQYNEAAGAAIDEGSEIELIIDREVLETSVTEFGPATDRAISDEGATVYVSPDPIEYGLFRYDDVACVVAYDEHNNPRCVFESTDETVVRWADERFETLSAEAAPLSAVIQESSTTPE